MTVEFNRYLEEYCLAPFAARLIPFGIFGTAQEILETTAMYRAAVPEGSDRYTADRPGVALITGDGKRYKLGHYLSVRTEWDVTSIDPDGLVSCNSEKLHLIRDRVEHIDPIDCGNRPAYVFMPFSHAGFLNSVRAVTKWSSLTVVCMPCCPEIIIPEPWLRCALTYQDRFCGDTDMNTVHIWKFSSPEELPKGD